MVTTTIEGPGVVMGASLWLASPLSKPSTQTTISSLFGTVPTGLEPSTGLLSLVGYLGVVVMGAGLWSASPLSEPSTQTSMVSLFDMVPVGLKPSTGLLGLVGYLGVVSWSMG